MFEHEKWVTEVDLKLSGSHKYLRWSADGGFGISIYYPTGEGSRRARTDVWVYSVPLPQPSTMVKLNEKPKSELRKTLDSFMDPSQPNQRNSTNLGVLLTTLVDAIEAKS